MAADMGCKRYKTLRAFSSIGALFSKSSYPVIASKSSTTTDYLHGQVFPGVKMLPNVQSLIYP